MNQIVRRSLSGKIVKPSFIANFKRQTRNLRKFGGFVRNYKNVVIIIITIIIFIVIVIFIIISSIIVIIIIIIIIIINVIIDIIFISIIRR